MNNRQSDLEPIKTILFMSIGSLVLYFITTWEGFLAVGLILSLSGLLSDNLAKRIYFYWIKLNRLLSLLINNLLLSLVFFFFLTPIAWLSKIFGKKNQLFLKNSKSSMFTECNKKFNKKTFEKTW